MQLTIVDIFYLLTLNAADAILMLSLSGGLFIMDEKRDCGLLIKQISTMITKNSNNYLRDKGLTASQIRYLQYIYSNQDKNVPMKDLETAFGVAQPTVAGIVRRLEDKQLVETERSIEDRRIKFIHLTEKGLSLMNDNLNKYKEFQANITSTLDLKERKELFRVLSAVLTNVSG